MIPQTVSDITFFNSWGKILSGKQFFLEKSVDFGAVVIATRCFFEYLADCDTVLADGTFKTAPEPFTQIYTVFGLFENQKISLGFAFLSNKSKESYKFLLSVLALKCEKIGKRFSPNVFLTDYEKGFTAAVRDFFPEAQHLGCYFHYCQAVLKKVQKFHLATEYRQNQKFREIIQRLLTLPYLPIGLVRTNYTRIKYDRKNLILIGIYDGISKIFEYFEKTWLNGQYPLKMWNLFERPASLTTTNSSENWHNIWNKKIGRFHPNFWVLIRKLKREEKMSKLALKSFHNGDIPREAKKKESRKREQIAALKRSYASRNRNFENYWKTLCIICVVPQLLLLLQ